MSAVMAGSSPPPMQVAVQLGQHRVLVGLERLQRRLEGVRHEALGGLLVLLVFEVSDVSRG